MKNQLSSSFTDLPPKKRFLQNFLTIQNNESNLKISQVFSIPQQKPRAIWRPFDDPKSDDDDETSDFESDTNSMKSACLSEEISSNSSSSGVIDLSVDSDIDDHPVDVREKRKGSHDDEPSAKRRKFNEANRRLNEKYVKLLFARAKTINQKEIIVRTFKCGKCDFKTYIKKVIDSHLVRHVDYKGEDVKINFDIIRRK